MSEKWITKENEKGDSNHIRMDPKKSTREKTVMATDMVPTASQLEKPIKKQRLEKG